MSLNGMATGSSKGMRIMNNQMQMTEFLQVFKQAIREEINLKKEGLRLLSTSDVADRLNISRDYLLKHVMHSKHFPKPVRLREGGELKFYQHEIDEYLMRLRNER